MVFRGGGGVGVVAGCRGGRSVCVSVGGADGFVGESRVGGVCGWRRWCCFFFLVVSRVFLCSTHLVRARCLLSTRLLSTRLLSTLLLPMRLPSPHVEQRRYGGKGDADRRHISVILNTHFPAYTWNLCRHPTITATPPPPPPPPPPPHTPPPPLPSPQPRPTRPPSHRLVAAVTVTVRRLGQRQLHHRRPPNGGRRVHDAPPPAPRVPSATAAATTCRPPSS